MKLSIKKMPNRWSQLALVSVVVIAVLGIGGVVLARHVYNDNLKPVATNQSSITVTIPSGYSLPQISKLLKEKKVIRSEWAFRQYVRNNQADDDIKAGTYDLSPSLTTQEIVSIITEGKIKTNLLTILPGKRLDQIRAAFISNGFSASDVDHALNPALYAGHAALVDKPSGASLEGYLYPDSFEKTSQTSPEEIIRQSLDQTQKQMTPDIRNSISAQGLSVYQGIILASIIEKEIPSSQPEARREAAQVFISRYKSGMQLGSDVTACYGAITAGAMKEGQNCDDFVLYDSAYNTHLHPGLPPTPISNVSASSLSAVANPTATSYLFFVAGKDCVTRFSSTLDEHNALIQQYGLSTESNSC